MSAHQYKHSSGVTLIELLTTVAVLALLLALALPSFNDAITRNRLTSQANEMAAALALARSEALRRSRDVTVCGSTDGATCASNWNGGWLAWVDDNRNGTLDATDLILRTGLNSSKDEVVSKDDVEEVVFDFRGRRASPGVGQEFELRVHPKGFDCDAQGVDYERVITVSSAGLIAARKPAAGCP